MAVEHTQADLETVRAFVAERRRQRRRSLESRLERARRDFSLIVAAIAERYDPLRIYQWGSLIDGKHFTELSDIDVAVEGVTDARAFFELLGAAEALTDLPLDIVQIEHVHPAYAEGIRRRGRIVYERGS